MGSTLIRTAADSERARSTEATTDDYGIDVDTTALLIIICIIDEVSWWSAWSFRSLGKQVNQKDANSGASFRNACEMRRV